MLAAASVALAALASVAVALPIDSTVLAAVDVSLSGLPNTTQTSQVAYYWQAGNAGACGLYSEDTDLVVGLPLEFYNDTGSVSSYCGSYIVVTNPINNETVTPRIADASATNNLLSLSVATWRALNGDGTDLQNVTWHFANASETAAAKASLASAAFTPTETIASSSAAAAASSSSTSDKTYVYAPSSSSTSQYVAPTTTTTPYVYTTTTTTQKPWTPTTTTTTYYKPTTTAAYKDSSSSSGKGSYSGQATYFYQNGVAGACGSVNGDGAYIVALDSAMYSQSLCGKSLTIYGNGRSVTATVADECPTCASSGSLDLSVAAFNAIASESDGVASITWSWN